MKILTKTLKTHVIALAVAGAFTFSAAAASACDGMKEHARADDTKSQASNDGDKTGATSGAKTGAKSKTKAGESKSRSEDGANKS